MQQLVLLDTAEGIQIYVNPQAIVSIHPLPTGGSSLHMMNGATLNVISDFGQIQQALGTDQRAGGGRTL